MTVAQFFRFLLHKRVTPQNRGENTHFGKEAESVR